MYFLLLAAILLVGFSFKTQILQSWKNFSTNQKLSLAMLALTLAGILISIGDFQAMSASVGNGSYANRLTELLIENSNAQLEAEKKKLSFDIINTLYKDFYQFDDKNSLVIRKLKAGQQILDEENLGLYLNGFEDLYQQCKSGLLSKEDIRINFQYLINPICNNDQVVNFLQQRGNGLKILCNKFYPTSILGKEANLDADSCK